MNVNVNVSVILKFHKIKQVKHYKNEMSKLSNGSGKRQYQYSK